jgi:hypothetical protein
MASSASMFAAGLGRDRGAVSAVDAASSGSAKPLELVRRTLPPETREWCRSVRRCASSVLAVCVSKLQLPLYG